ncbi:MAG: hypothetical protein IJ877_06165 [Candidatus Gastranaerophilales bacterium]|nr:hypothetical protein [Candidatus Gastranaerophilales bacterium]
MKIQSIQQQNQNFKGIDISNVTNFVAKHPGLVSGVASSSVVAQKLVMSGSEVSLAPLIDLGTGKAITTITKEKDGRTNQSAKVQAVRTVSQTVGGTITGVIIRALCIGAMTALLVKAGGKAGEEISAQINKSGNNNAYEIQKNAAAIGKNIGGLIATFVMMGTNFLLDVPIINFINKKISDVVFKEDKNKEVKNG